MLDIFGFSDVDCVTISGLMLDATSVFIGQNMTFSFQVAAKRAGKIRLEYGVDYDKASGKRNRKIFHISETMLKKNGKKDYTKIHSFADTSSRKHYPGIHSITLIVNSTEQGTRDFEVLGAE